MSTVKNVPYSIHSLINAQVNLELKNYCRHSSERNSHLTINL